MYGVLDQRQADHDEYAAPCKGLRDRVGGSARQHREAEAAEEHEQRHGLAVEEPGDAASEIAAAAVQVRVMGDEHPELRHRPGDVDAEQATPTGCARTGSGASCTSAVITSWCQPVSER